jgi:hypothetical protein
MEIYYFIQQRAVHKRGTDNWKNACSGVGGTNNDVSNKHKVCDAHPSYQTSKIN